MTDPPSPPAGTSPSAGLDATLISSPQGPMASSLNPQAHTSAVEAHSSAPTGPVVDVGSLLGPYKLLDKLGEGGMGAVYKAQHTRLGRFVAIKVLPPHVSSRPDALARFDREMKAVGSLHHPNIVHANDAGEFNGVHYLSMEYVEGQDLHEFVKARGPMSVLNACKAIRQATIGLAAAHKMGLVHRDIKPSNLFVAKKTGQIKILDMGLALLSQDEEPAALTSAGQCFGTPDYMAPEQWNDAHTCDARADLYSLGCTLFFLLVGRPPYHGETHRTAANKMKGHLIDLAPDLRTARSDIPEGLDTIYRKLMAKAPGDRFASANELAEALAPFARQSPPQTGGSAGGRPAPRPAPRPESRTTGDISRRSESDADTTVLDDSPTKRLVRRRVTAPARPVASRGPNRQRLLIAAGATAMVLMLGVIVVAIANRRSTESKRDSSGDTTGGIATNGSEGPTGIGRKQPVATALPDPPVLPQVDYAAERKAAEWLADGIQGKSSLHLMNGQGEVVLLTAENPQLPHGEFFVSKLNLYGPAYDDAGFAKLAGCRRLQHVSVRYNGVLTANGLRHVASCDRLKSLEVWACPAIDGSLLISLLASFKELDSLGLAFCDLSSEALRSWPEMPQLVSLNLGGAAFDEEGLRLIVRHCPGLEAITVGKTIGDPQRWALSALTSLPKLQFVHCSGAQLTEEGVSVLRSLRKLRSLSVSTPLTDPSTSLQTMAPLAESIMDMQVIDYHDGDSGLTDADIATILKFRRLRTLRMSGPWENGSPTDEHLQQLATFPDLKELNLDFPVVYRRYTPDGINKFRMARPDVKLHADDKDYPPQSP